MIRMNPLAALPYLLFAALPVQAQVLADPPAASPAASVGSSVHERLLDAITGAIDPQALEQRIGSQLHMALMADKEIADMEKASPGTVVQIVDVMRPILKRHSARLEIRRRAEILRILLNGLSIDQAGEAAAFYGSPLGKRLMASAIDNLSFQSRMANGVSGNNDATLSAVIDDSRRTTAAMMKALTPEESAAMEAELKNKGWVLQFRLVQGEMQAVNARVENEPMAPEDEEAITRAVTAVVQKRMREKE